MRQAFLQYISHENKKARCVVYSKIPDWGCTWYFILILVLNLKANAVHPTTLVNGQQVQ